VNHVEVPGSGDGGIVVVGDRMLGAAISKILGVRRRNDWAVPRVFPGLGWGYAAAVITAITAITAGLQNTQHPYRNHMQTQEPHIMVNVLTFPLWGRWYHFVRKDQACFGTVGLNQANEHIELDTRAMYTLYRLQHQNIM